MYIIASNCGRRGLSKLTLLRFQWWGRGPREQEFLLKDPEDNLLSSLSIFLSLRMTSSLAFFFGGGVGIQIMARRIFSESRLPFGRKVLTFATVVGSQGAIVGC